MGRHRVGSASLGEAQLDPARSIMRPSARTGSSAPRENRSKPNSPPDDSGKVPLKFICGVPRQSVR